MQKGYYYDKRRDTYVVRHMKDGKRQYVGSFKTSDEAARAYLDYTAIQYQTAVMNGWVYEEKKATWLKPLLSLKARFARRFLEKQMDKHITKQLGKL